METIDYSLLPDGFYDWVKTHLNDDVMRLRLSSHAREAWRDFAILQIECRRKTAGKLPEELACDRFLFPTSLSAQQSTSDVLARFHATLVDERSEVVDLTSGLGIDAIHISRQASRVTALDIDPVKTEILSHNAAVMNAGEITTLTADCRDYIERLPDCAADVLFIDPARRADDGSRLYSLTQCQPDVVAMLPQMKRVARKLIVKMSPMLDVTQTLRDLPMTSNMYVLGLGNECKELTAVCDLTVESVENPSIHVVDFHNDGSKYDVMTFTLSEEAAAIGEIDYATPKAGDWLYEPSATAMKAAPRGIICTRFGLKRLHPNTNLYVSSSVADGFPGTRWHVDDVMPFSSSVVKRFSRSVSGINVAVRNFPLSADTLRRKLKVNDIPNDSLKLIGTTVKGGDQLLLLLSRP